MNYADFNVNQVRQKLPQNEFYNRRLTHLKVSTTPGEPLGLDSGKKHRWDEPEVPRFSFSGTAKSRIGSFLRNTKENFGGQYFEILSHQTHSKAV